MPGKSVLVTGAAGFLGGRLAKALAAQGWAVTATSRRRQRAAELNAAGARFVAGDLTDPAFCRVVTQGQAAVIHCAALSSPWGPYEAFFQANVLATRQLIAAFRAQGGRRFINIGTPSIYFDFRDQLGVSEATPLPELMVNAYARTKWEAEQEVIAAHGPDLATLSLRPRAIIGAEDQVIFPRLIRAYHEGRLRIIGPGDNLASLTSVPNIVQAVTQALTVDPGRLGLALNLADPEPVRLWDEINHVLTALGHAPVHRRLPLRVAMGAAWLSEQLARWRGGAEPTLTRYGIGVLAYSFTLDTTLARERLGYNPPLQTRDGIAEFVAWYQQTAADVT
ncbi:MAG: SDR family NAD(P)-dependent oxidoreductase [Bacteroidetes bacterium]|nr:MAG: SDR family NAD(P)-dependent oxidoreductase [Bacteroidota bacterium]